MKQVYKYPNFRYHNGHWWYHVTKDHQWLIHNGTRWQIYDPKSYDRWRAYYVADAPRDAADGAALQSTYPAQLYYVPTYSYPVYQGGYGGYDGPSSRSWYYRPHSGSGGGGYGSG